MDLINSLIQEGWLKTPRIIGAFRKIKRVDFLPEEIKDLAELNEALPIGYGQTISQPLVVAFMLEQLQPQPGDKILDIGSGSGWTTALLAYIVSQEGNSKSKIRNPKQIQNSKFKIQKGKVIAIEVIPELMEFGRKNVEKYNFIERGIVEFICADGSKGYKKEAPFDKILVSATAQICYPAWKEQLKIGGRIVTPIGSSIWLFIKKSEADFEEIEYPGFAFVPLIEK
jgi:protein-L-isoaspartate(D-aspartate) O-methyltransferase